MLEWLDASKSDPQLSFWGQSEAAQPLSPYYLKSNPAIFFGLRLLCASREVIESGGGGRIARAQTVGDAAASISSEAVTYEFQCRGEDMRAGIDGFVNQLQWAIDNSLDIPFLMGVVGLMLGTKYFIKLLFIGTCVLPVSYMWINLLRHVETPTTSFCETVPMTIRSLAQGMVGLKLLALLDLPAIGLFS